VGAQDESTHNLERAFCEAVERYALGEWIPAVPDECRVSIRQKDYSIREICLLLLTNDRPLPEKTAPNFFRTCPLSTIDFAKNWPCVLGTK
jgi:hypothetical protein